MKNIEIKKTFKKLLSPGFTNAKLAKNEKLGFKDSFILYLSPFTKNSEGVNVCPHASAGCIALCLDTAGMGIFSNVQASRIGKTDYLLKNRAGFLTQLWGELERINKKAGKEFKRVPVRLNGTSDLDWCNLFKIIGKDLFSLESIQFYDYTKVVKRLQKYAGTNYHLTFSRSEINEAESIEALKAGHNVAVVFRDELPETWHGFPVVNGDESDLRFLDPRGVVVGLKAKGKARKAVSGFVVD